MRIDLPSMRRNGFLLFNAVTIAIIAGLFFPDKSQYSERNFKSYSIASSPSSATYSNITKPPASESVKDVFINFIFNPWNLLLAEEFYYQPSANFISIIQRNVYYVFISINAP